MTSVPRLRESGVARVLWLVLIGNVAVAALKLAYGLSTGALGIRADGFHSALDAVNNVVALLIARLAARPPDAEHPYGHSKFEVLGSLAIGVVICGLVLELGSESSTELLHGGAKPVEAQAFVLMIGTLAVNLVITFLEHRAGRRLNRPLLIADARHTLSDVFVTLGVLAGLAGVRAGFSRADALAALGISGIIAWLAFDIFRQAVRVLSDHVVIPPDEIEAVAARVLGVLRCHSVRSRGSAGDVRVDLIAEVDPVLTITEAHAIADRVEDVIQKRWPEVKEVVVHMEPLHVAGSALAPTHSVPPAKSR